MTVSKRLRFEILRRDNHQCRYCGVSAPDVKLAVDHVTPVALGGTDDPTNLVAACVDCNSGKSSVPVGADKVAEVSDDAVRWATAIQQAADILSAEMTARDAYIAAFIQTWARNLTDDLIGTVGRFYDLGLPQNVMVDAAEYTSHARGVYDRAAYFAGICWKRVRAMQEIASQIVQEGD